VPAAKTLVAGKNFHTASGPRRPGKPSGSAERERQRSEVDNRTDAFALVHQVKGFVDLLQTHGMGDKGVQRDLTGLRLGHIARQLGTALDATECAAAPDTTGHQLER